MNLVLRVVLYAVLVAGGLTFGQRFMAGYASRTEKAATKYEGSDLAHPAGPETTNAPAEATHAPAEPANPADARSTNRPPGESTNALAAVAKKRARTVPRPQPEASQPSALWGVYAALTLAAVVGLGLMVAHDVAQLVARLAHRELFNDEGEGVADPEYERAEQVWANGDHLEAIRLMREYLAKNPRQAHAALRIAEIYEKDLNNHLAAALEYEEILKLRLDAERWGWAAIHLCNLYLRLNQPQKAETLLRQIAEDYGETAAAKKARERLNTLEPAPAPEEASAAETPEPGGFKLPPGFRPKKK